MILVAGGAGYIGSHVCKQLHKRGYEHIVVDDLSHGYAENVKWGEFIKADIGDKEQMGRIFEYYKIDIVMHFSAFIEVGESVIEPEKYYKNNLENTIRLIETMRKHNVNKFIFSSTAAVYGMPERIPIFEEDIKKPINPYGRTKYIVEQILDDYDSAYGFKNVRFRYFNAAGADKEAEIGEAHIPETHLVPLVINTALGKRESIKIFGTDYDTKDGTAVRDYIHVEDLAKAHIMGMEYLLKGGDTNYFNLGSGVGYSVKEIIDSVKRISNMDFKVVETDRRPGDPSYLIANSDKVKKVLGWQTDNNLENIITDALEWHKKQENR